MACARLTAELEEQNPNTDNISPQEEVQITNNERESLNSALGDESNSHDIRDIVEIDDSNTPKKKRRRRSIPA